MVSVEMFFDAKETLALKESGYDFKIPAIVLNELGVCGLIETRPTGDENLLARDVELSRLILKTVRDRTFYDGVIRILVDHSLRAQDAHAIEECRTRIIRRIKKEVPPLRRANIALGLYIVP